LTLVDVYDDSADSYGRTCVALFGLLAEREAHQNISHKSMPTWDEHSEFVASRPYLHWYMIVSDYRAGVILGSCYLSRQREIGVSVYRAYRGRGIGKWAVQELMRRHPGRFLANVNPLNDASARLFEGLGFKLIQHTYATKEKT
jgi:RimJ/RimL family protein N-acetyltransferase